MTLLLDEAPAVGMESVCCGVACCSIKACKREHRILRGVAWKSVRGSSVDGGYQCQIRARGI